MSLLEIAEAISLARKPALEAFKRPQAESHYELRFV